ncbi:hypothetical protein HW932_20985 [Allochromatium humboldtianum]|uniref:Uncharacterized protein n=1 Tax=Allochromatium humboldtianum TaxID=504901 RepID=A0A850RHS1_9GAMM|nr:hypothetical protein [Allochromatium humboldtianum]NVZ11726.1 hypothetical protein [Allochromatium humboldtianum]
MPWLKQQQESGAVDFSEVTAQRYMRIASNPSRATDLERPSIRAALELLTEDKAGITTLRALLLDMRDRKGWKALGYSSFEEYGKTELGYEKSQIYRLAEAGEIAKSLDSPIGESAPESHLRPLAPLTDDERRKVWEEATAKAARRLDAGSSGASLCIGSAPIRPCIPEGLGA